MSCTVEQMQHAIEIITAFVRNAHLRRVLHEIDPEPALNFWRVTYGNCLDMAVIEWCKLFGSDHEAHQPVHWKNVVPVREHDEFRAGLRAATGLSADEWQTYWERMKGYRDNHAAHFSEAYLRPENDPRYPKLTAALKAAYFYYERLLKMMEDRGFGRRYPEDIRDYCRRFAEQAAESATTALASTADMKERVL